MNEQTLNTKANFETNKEQPINPDDQGKQQGYDSCRTEILELIRLCNLSRMPEKITEFIEQGVSNKQAQESLMFIMLERTMKAEILSTLPQDSSEGLVMQAAKARAMGEK